MTAHIRTWGEVDPGAWKQIQTIAETTDACALMADNHQGYSMPIGGVAAYRNHVSPSGVGYDIACGNKAVRLDIPADEVRGNIDKIMDDIVRSISFGVGRTNKEDVPHPLFNRHKDAWAIIQSEIDFKGTSAKRFAQDQLGTVGSGNHFVDVFVDESDAVWVGVHLGSRGLSHRIATHFIKAGGGKDGIHADPVLLPAESGLGRAYIACMELAGEYAYAGRDWVCDRVASIVGGEIVEEVHNHHNFAWREPFNGDHAWIVRKGATPCYPGQVSFIGGSMGDISVIIRGREDGNLADALYSTVHGAGRVMSRTQAAGKRRWKKGRSVRVSDGKISRAMMEEWLQHEGVTLRGGGCDESPHVYKRLPGVLAAHADTIEIVHTLKPIGVAMAGPNVFDPYKD
jgi:tRNA-splicing ligase RtcB (3'-phosphate/5'-hydroxy nucleic acid ligase)